VLPFWARKVTTVNIAFALRSISSGPVVGTEQKLNQINRKPIAMLMDQTWCHGTMIMDGAVMPTIEKLGEALA
jgi:hypothetical protein